jgi:putative transposase
LLYAKAKASLREIWLSETLKDAGKAFDFFVATYEAKYPKATKCLQKDRKALLAFYDFPAEQWGQLRTINPIESTFATVRLRTVRTKGAGSRLACLTMVYQFALSAEKRWRKLNGHQLLADVINGVQFKDGIRSYAA